MGICRQRGAGTIAKIKQRNIWRRYRYAISKHGMAAFIKSNSYGQRYSVTDDRNITLTSKIYILLFRSLQCSVLIKIGGDAKGCGVVDRYPRHIVTTIGTLLYRIETCPLQIDLEFTGNILTI